MGTATWFVYMLECKGGRLYTGISPDVAARFVQHCSGRGAAFTRGHKPIRILAARACASRSEALREEIAVKRLRPPQKLAWARAAPWKPVS